MAPNTTRAISYKTWNTTVKYPSSEFKNHTRVYNHPFDRSARPCRRKALRHVRIIQYIPINLHTVFALLCFVVVIHWLIFPYPSGLLHWHCGNLTIAPMPAKQPWWIWINTSCEFIMNDCITTTKQSTTNPCAYFLGYTVLSVPRSTSSGLGLPVHTYRLAL